MPSVRHLVLAILRSRRGTNRQWAIASVLVLALAHGADAEPPLTLFVLNAPSIASRGNDFVMAFTARGFSGTLLPASRGLTGASDLACQPTVPNHVYVAVSDFDRRVNEVQVLDGRGALVDVLTGFGPAGGSTLITFDAQGALYVASNGTLFRNGTPVASIPAGIGKIAADSAGNVYLTHLFTASQLLRVTPAGVVEVVADGTVGLVEPFGIAVDPDDAVFVANAVPSAPATIVKILPSGAAELFASGISFQPGPRGMSFDMGPEERLYVALTDDDVVLSFDRSGDSAVFADRTDGLLLPADVEWGACAVDLDGDGVPDHEDECPGSSTDATVMLGGCDSQAPNAMVSPGCGIADLVGRCVRDGRSRRAFVACVTNVVRELRERGAIPADAAGAILRCAARRGPTCGPRQTLVRIDRKVCPANDRRPAVVRERACCQRPNGKVRCRHMPHCPRNQPR